MIFFSIYIVRRGITTAADIGISNDLLEKALFYAKDYRTRYSVFKSPEELGILGDIVDEVLCRQNKNHEEIICY